MRLLDGLFRYDTDEYLTEHIPEMSQCVVLGDWHR